MIAQVAGETFKLNSGDRVSTVVKVLCCKFSGNKKMKFVICPTCNKYPSLWGPR